MLAYTLETLLKGAVLFYPFAGRTCALNQSGVSRIWHAFALARIAPRPSS